MADPHDNRQDLNHDVDGSRLDGSQHTGAAPAPPYVQTPVQGYGQPASSYQQPSAPGPASASANIGQPASVYQQPPAPGRVPAQTPYWQPTAGGYVQPAPPSMQTPVQGYAQPAPSWQQPPVQGGGQPVPPYMPPQAQQPFAAPSYVQPVVTKDHVAAGLLAIFLGIFGVHKFYLGYNTAGFVMLAITILGSIFTIGLAAGVMWVISLVEGIIYLAKSQSEFDVVYVANKKEWF